MVLPCNPQGAWAARMHVELVSCRQQAEAGALLNTAMTSLTARSSSMVLASTIHTHSGGHFDAEAAVLLNAVHHDIMPYIESKDNQNGKSF